MKNILLILGILISVYFFLPKADFIGASIILYGLTLLVDWIFIGFFTKEFKVMKEMKVLEKITFVKKENSKLVFIVGVVINVVLFIGLLEKLFVQDWDVSIPLLALLFTTFCFCYMIPKFLDKD